MDRNFQRFVPAILNKPSKRNSDPQDDRAASAPGKRSADHLDQNYIIFNRNKKQKSSKSLVQLAPKENTENILKDIRSHKSISSFIKGRSSQPLAERALWTTDNAPYRSPPNACLSAVHGSTYKQKSLPNVRVEPSMMPSTSKSALEERSSPMLRQNEPNWDDSNNANVVIMEMRNLTAALQNQLDDIQQELRKNNGLLNQLLKQRNTVSASKPACLPFKRTKDLLEFEDADEEQYADMVNYLAYLGGINSTDLAARYFKAAFDLSEEIIPNITRAGQKKINRFSLSDSKFARACEEALAENTSLFSKVNHVEFAWAMNKALKSIKERFRRRQYTVARQRNNALLNSDENSSSTMFSDDKHENQQRESDQADTFEEGQRFI